MSAGAAPALAREADVFTAALVGAPAAPYVVREYVRGNEALALSPAPGFDSALVALARRGPRRARIADAYAGHFARRSTLRRKLALLVAILEVVPPSDRAFAPRPGSPLATALRLAATVAAALALALAGAVVLAPLQLASRLRREP